jgi:hypothetical protein
MQNVRAARATLDSAMARTLYILGSVPFLILGAVHFAGALMSHLPTWSIFRRRGNRFAVENATT